jgi:DnaK suppressor protein
MTLTHKSPPVGSIGTDELAMLRSMLEQQREFRLEQLERLKRGAVRRRPRTPADIEVDQSLRRGARSALYEVEHALRRIDDATFGRCLRCGASQSLERLEILPYAALCMQCQRERDDQA